MAFTKAFVMLDVLPVIFIAFGMAKTSMARMSFITFPYYCTTRCGSPAAAANRRFCSGEERTFVVGCGGLLAGGTRRFCKPLMFCEQERNIASNEIAEQSSILGHERHPIL